MPTDPKESRNPAVPPAGRPASAGATREERLAQALRDNLKKRKAQQRQRQEGQTGGKGPRGGDAS